MDIEDQIRKAVEEGKFDNLAGQGKPLDMWDNPYEDPSWRTAYKMLKDNGFTLPWIETRREIESEIQANRRGIKSIREAREGLSEVEWKRAEQRFRDTIAAINKKIFVYNLQTPSPQFQMLPLDPDKELNAQEFGEKNVSSPLP